MTKTDNPVGVDQTAKADSAAIGPVKPPPAAPPDATRIASAPVAPAPPVEDGTTIADDGDRTQIAPRKPVGATELGIPPRPTPAAPEWVPVAPGVLINNNYRIVDQISAGGMGEVYRAENLFTGDPVAVKVALPSLARDESIVQLFKREARILGQLTDDAIVRYHNFVLDQGLDRYCLIMEFIEGWTLWDHVRANGPVSESDGVALLRRIAAGLSKAHRRGVTHRDLSPDNVMLRDQRMDQPVLIDFGIARSAEMGDALSGRFAGKVKYVAPEQLGHHGGEVGASADIYGLALMMAAALRAEPLSMGGTVEEAAQARRSIPNLSGLPPALFPLLQYMLEPVPTDRPPSMDAVVRMLDDPTLIPARYRLPQWIDGAAAPETTDEDTTSGITHGGYLDSSESPFAPAPTPAPAVPLPPPPQRRGAILAAAAAFVILAGAGAFWVLQPREPATPPADPVNTVAEVSLPPRDTATREGWLADQDLPACTMAWRIPAGIDAGQIGMLADGPRDTAALSAQYDNQFAARPAVVLNQLAPSQCPAVTFLRELGGRAAPAPVLSLDADRLIGQGTVAGTVRGADGRSTWLFLVAADGAMHDLSRQLQPQGDGTQTFSFDMALAQGSAAARQLIVAVTSEKPLVTAATLPDAAPAERVLPAALSEIAAAGGRAAADQAVFLIEPPAAQPPVPEPAPEPTPEPAPNDAPSP
ncbi:MAG: serine/threonine protein kinase [Paracoccus denitrificans]|nr:MAG: serine/threonine protein kinase [Paracoccus denitrificans]PZO86182.1 MAG: serine/threonine protein kinase [Paracoccus denitrificans]